MGVQPTMSTNSMTQEGNTENSTAPFFVRPIRNIVRYYKYLPCLSIAHPPVLPLQHDWVLRGDS